MFCPNCGASVEGRFCAKCGTAVTAAANPSASAPPPPGAQAYGNASGPGAQPYTAPTATAGGMAPNVAATLSYVLTFITGILFLVLAPYNQDRFVRFHAFQSIFFAVACFVINIAFTLLAVAILPWMLTSMLSMLLTLAFLGVWILMMVKAYQGERFKLPVIGDLAEKQA